MQFVFAVWMSTIWYRFMYIYTISGNIYVYYAQGKRAHKSRECIAQITQRKSVLFLFFIRNIYSIVV